MNNMQTALELTGPGVLAVNAEKPIYPVGPYQALARVEAVGLCFSDIKLLDQFSEHPRKSAIVAGIDPAVLDDYPAYKPNGLPTVPGHEAVCTIVATGDKTRHCRLGQRMLIQADCRWLKTARSNGAFGYNIEGGLQQYVLLDERVFVSPDSVNNLLPVDEKLGRSAVALTEPWACVESAYTSPERQTPLSGGRLLIVLDPGRDATGLEAFAPGRTTCVCGDSVQRRRIAERFGDVVWCEDAARTPDEAFDDVVYFGSDAAMLEALNDKPANGGIVNVVLGGRKLARPVSLGVGRAHYSGVRWIGTPGNDARDSYAMIPDNGEIRDGERILVAGAGGPMGQMHVIRAIGSGKTNLTLVAADFDEKRLANLRKKAEPMARSSQADLKWVNPANDPVDGPFDYVAIMAPVAALVAEAIEKSAPHARINIFAGIPAAVRQPIDLNACIERSVFIIGTSGSRLSDMRRVLDKLACGRLDTNSSVEAVCGMAGAVEGMAAVEQRALDGKIIVYPELESMPLISLPDLAARYPEIAATLDHGRWTLEAENALLTLGRPLFACGVGAGGLS